MGTSAIKMKLGFMRDFFKAHIINDEEFDNRLFVKAKGYVPNLINPQTFSEKLLFLKQNYRNPIETLCSDKYHVVEYLKLCDCGEIGKKIYGVFHSVDEIKWDALPDEFFIRCNHMSGCNFIFKKSFSYKKKKEILDTIDVCLKHNWYYSKREWNYKHIEPLIICEECLRDNDGNLPVDYKFYCFSGQLKYYMVSKGEYNHDVRSHKFDVNNVSIDHYFKKIPTLPESEVVLPKNIEEMKRVASLLCKPFPHVRVDLYDLNGRIVFGELTFYSNGGVVNIYSDEYDREIGSWIKLEQYFPKCFLHE